jgi:hypothetical protein
MKTSVQKSKFKICKQAWTKGLMLLICLGLLWSFQNNLLATNEAGTNFTKYFTDQNSEEENFESQDLVFNYGNKNYAILKHSSGNANVRNQLPISGFKLSISTPPPNFSS